MRARSVVAFIAAFSVGCSALLGVKGIIDEDGTPGDDGSTDGTLGDGGPNDPDGAALPDGNVTCSADLQTDPKNCGRCGRDCLGAPCTAGRCDPIVLASGLTNPSGLWLTADKVYITTGPHHAKPPAGTVLELAKTAGVAPKQIRGGQVEPWGLFIDGITLYWADSDYTNNDMNRHGGIWRCTLPACATETLVAGAEWPVNPILVDGVVYIPEANASQFSRVLLNGQQKYVVLAGGSAPLNIAADKTHVYGTTTATELYRALLDGGGTEPVGPQSAPVGSPPPYNVAIPGDIKLDDDRYYYSYSLTGETGGGRVVSRSKANVAGPLLEYGVGSGNTRPRGIALDNTYIYWTNWGTSVGHISNSDGDVRACPKAGCPASGPIILAKDLEKPYHIAVDDTAVYVSIYTSTDQATGQVIKIAKP